MTNKPGGAKGPGPAASGAPVSERRSLSTLTRRAVRRRCPNCGSRGVFAGYWKLAPHCPGCGHKFLREPGYWVGAVIFNTTLAIIAFLLTFGIFLVATWPEVAWDWLGPTAIAVTVVLPVLFYPWAQELWMAYDLFVHPLEPHELEAGRTRIDQSPPLQRQPGAD